MKVNVTVNNELMKRVDAYAKDHYTTRSGLMSLALAQYLNQVEAMEAIRELASLLREVADKNEMTEDQRAQLDALETTFKVLSRGQ